MDLQLPDDDAGQRLDRYLRKLLRAAPLGLIHRMIRSGEVRVDGAKVAAAYRLQAGETVALALSEAHFTALRGHQAEAVASTAAAGKTAPLATAYRDEHIWIIDKPAGLAVHGGTGQTDDLTSQVRAATGAGEATTFRVAPAHRIDRGTSGLVAFGVSAQGLRGLVSAFRDGRAEKTYLALTAQPPVPRSGLIDVPLDVEDRGSRHARARPSAQGRLVARTHYRTVAAGPRSALLEVRISTGRTHQIRAHLASIDCPLLGDTRYGGPSRAGLESGRIALHAAELRLPHPVSGRPLAVLSNLPADLESLAPPAPRAD